MWANPEPNQTVRPILAERPIMKTYSNRPKLPPSSLSEEKDDVDQPLRVQSSYSQVAESRRAVAGSETKTQVMQSGSKRSAATGLKVLISTFSGCV